MVNSVSIVSAQPAAQPKPVETKAKTAESKPKQAPKETVQISSAGQAALSASKAALQEVTETHEQTVQEANTGDLQAKHLLAEQAAEQAAMSSGQAVSQTSAKITT